MPRTRARWTILLVSALFTILGAIAAAHHFWMMQSLDDSYYVIAVPLWISLPIFFAGLLGLLAGLLYRTS